jgi:integrase
MLLVLYGTGLRVSELIGLDRTDVDLSECLLKVRQSKFGKTRLVPFGPQLQKVLVEYDKRQPASGDGVPFFTTRLRGRVKADTLQHNYRVLWFVREMRERNVTPHVSQNTNRPGGSAINGRTTRHAGYQVSQRKRKRIEEVLACFIFRWSCTLDAKQ